jgi:tetratricopeptide (TPR) repeat protein
MAVSSALAQPVAKPRVALVIGNAKYETAVGPLRNAVNDAKAVAKTLRGLGFFVNEEHNVTRDELFEAVAGFRAKIKEAEVALFYYAGHGISVAGSNYLIPIKSGYAPAAADENALRMLAETKLFNAEQVVAEMSAAGGRCNLVILDACRNTPVARDPATRDASRAGGLTEMKPPAGSLIAFATDAGHTAQDGTGANGLYTGELVQHLRTPGLTIEQVFKRTRAGVMQQSRGTQVPAEYSRLVGEDIYLAGLTAVDPPEPATPKAAPVEPPGASAINKLAASGHVSACVDALHLATAAKGRGDFAASPLDTLLELAKEEIKVASGSSPQVESAMQTCQLVLGAIRDCLPPAHPRYNELTAKADNRLGDCLMLMGKPAEALPLYQTAASLAPADAYPLYNRGRAQLALGNKEAARADFTAAADPKFNQPKARKLALTALGELE